MKYYTYRVLRASGKLETLKVPLCFDVEALAIKLHNSVVVLIDGADAYHVSSSGKVTKLDYMPQTAYEFGRLDFDMFQRTKEGIV